MLIEIATTALLCLSPVEVHEELRRTGHEFAFAKWLSWDLTLRYYIGPDGMTTIGDWPSKGAKGWCLHYTESETLRARLGERSHSGAGRADAGAGVKK